MAETPEAASLRVALIVLATAGIVVPLFNRLRVSPVLGFMLVGAAVGPFGLGRLAAGRMWLDAVTIADPGSIEPVARLGVVLLLFMIGLELSFERLWSMRRLVFGLGPLQVLASTGLLAAAARLAGLPNDAALVLGLAGAMSSTAVVIQVLADEKRLTAPVGRGSFAILLFQDLAVVPILFALGLLGSHGNAGGFGGLALAAGQALAAVLGIVALGRLALRPLFRFVARSRSPEVFVAACLLVVLACATATAAAGVSMALGALIGGLLLAGTEYRRQVELTIEPFKGLLLGVFLISVGLGLDLGRVVAAPALILGAALALVALKLVAVAAFGRAFGLPWLTGVQAGLLLGPAGEFSFVILGVAVAERLLPAQLAQQALVTAALSMAAIPPLSWLGTQLARRVASSRAPDPALVAPPPHSEVPRVVIAGFGRVGQTVAAMLEVHRIPYVAIDRDPDRVAKQRKLGRPIYFGDMGQRAVLHQLDLQEARALVVTVDEHGAADALVAAARAERGDLLIVARARDVAHAAHLYRVGASDAVPETIEASLQLAEAVLVDVGIAMGPVIASIHEKRAEFQASIRANAPHAEIRTLGRRRLRDVLRTGPSAGQT
jgi:CPA2 family monovalent cation:H+ antiporter-2